MGEPDWLSCQRIDISRCNGFSYIKPFVLMFDYFYIEMLLQAKYANQAFFLRCSYDD